ncbi:hypothetical protein [Acetobacter sp. P5B1]|uniref:hypothetical protein n=1 Tax=Acetobacter sp. P5B1 TaxID=2762620 RepID=UPI001C057CFC|nr:hypothetical protein [Acetobacter sp. P5B1]
MESLQIKSIATGYVLVSWHGFVVVHDIESSSVKLSTVQKIENINDVKIFSESLLENSFIKKEGDYFCFYKSDLYLTVYPNAVAVFSAKHLNDWEKFQILPVNDFLKIWHAAKNAWEQTEGNSFIQRGFINFSSNFHVNIGKYKTKIENIKYIFHDNFIKIEKKYFCSLNHNIYYSKFSDSYFNTPKIWVVPMGNAANRALEYLVACRIKKEVPSLEIQNIHLPEWGIYTPTKELPPLEMCRLGWSRFWIDVPGLADCLKRGVITSLFQDAFCYNVEFLPSREESRKILGPTKKKIKADGFGDDILVCNIRANEILYGEHRNYIVLPPEYYKMILEDSGLSPVFYGQVEDNAYIASLKKMFPNAPFIQGKGAEHDFDVLRNSKNIAISVSTFSWLAAWLSYANRIYIPINAMYNPNQNKLQNFLDLSESVFRYVLLPFCWAENLYNNSSKFFEKQNYMARYARFMTHQEVQNLLDRARSSWPEQPLLKDFDKDFYLNTYEDARNGINNGIPSALDHYIHHGIHHGYRPYFFDDEFYTITYPDAALEVSLGYYKSVFDHYQKKGIFLGYKRNRS